MPQVVLRQPKHFQPLDLLFLPERRLQGAVLRLETFEEVYSLEVLLVGLVEHLELRQWRIVELQGQRLAIEPERDVLS